MRARARRTLAAPAVAALCAVAGVLAGCGSADSVDCDDFRFDEAKWVDAKGEHGGDRRSQGLALSKCGRLTGRTDEQVIALLGSPNTEQGRGHWVYALDPASSLGDSGALEVFFRNGRVSSTEAY
jgi:hypothetical protein